MSEQVFTWCLILATVVVVFLQCSVSWAGTYGYALSGALIAFGVALLALLQKQPEA
ncbi:MAG TPA: hypothetical protein VFM32_11330 [Spongiibacteraceae bacterium]|nr:hypothetical protein [Spongiibacteraceae bacterium]